MGRQKEQGQPEEKETNVVRETISFIIYIGIVFLLTYLVIHYVGQRTQVSGSSMEATLSDGDNLIVDKISYRFHDPERYDIIVFPYKYEKNTFYIKRIIGLPGETVQIDEQGNIYVDGEVLDESYGREVILDPGEAEERLRWRMTNILFWVTTGMPVRTAVTPAWARFSAKTLSEGRG